MLIAPSCFAVQKTRGNRRSGKNNQAPFERQAFHPYTSGIACRAEPVRSHRRRPAIILCRSILPLRVSFLPLFVALYPHVLLRQSLTMTAVRAKASQPRLEDQHPVLALRALFVELGLYVHTPYDLRQLLVAQHFRRVFLSFFLSSLIALYFLL